MSISTTTINSAYPSFGTGALGGVQPSERGKLEQALNRRITQRTWGRLKFRIRLGPGRVVVQGVSPSNYLKQLALAAVLEVLPKAQVELKIRVAKTGTPSESGSPSAAPIPQE